MATATLNFTEDEAANELLASNALALLTGMLLDQQVPMEWAFHSPYRLTQRIGGELTPANIAALSLEEVEAIFREQPALHRYPAAMGKRVHALCVHLVEEYGGDAAAVWETASDGKELFDNLLGLPGYGKQKAQIFLSLLAKRMDVCLDGWEKKAGDYGKEGYRSIADVTGPDALLKVREHKQAMKAKAKAAKSAGK